MGQGANRITNKKLGEEHAKPLPSTLVVSVEIEIVSTDKMHLVVRENLQDLYDSPYTVRHLSRLRNPSNIPSHLKRRLEPRLHASTPSLCFDSLPELPTPPVLFLSPCAWPPLPV